MKPQFWVFFLLPLFAKADDSILDPIRNEELRVFASQVCTSVRNNDFVEFKSMYAQLSDYEFQAKKRGLRTDSVWVKQQIPKLEKFKSRQTNDWAKLSDLFLFAPDRSWFLVSFMTYQPVKAQSNVFDVSIRIKNGAGFYILTLKECVYSGSRWYINQGILLESTIWTFYPE